MDYKLLIFDKTIFFSTTTFKNQVFKKPNQHWQHFKRSHEQIKFKLCPFDHTSHTHTHQNTIPHPQAINVNISNELIKNERPYNVNWFKETADALWIQIDATSKSPIFTRPTPAKFTLRFIIKSFMRTRFICASSQGPIIISQLRKLALRHCTGLDCCITCAYGGWCNFRVKSNTWWTRLVCCWGSRLRHRKVWLSSLR